MQPYELITLRPNQETTQITHTAKPANDKTTPPQHGSKQWRRTKREPDRTRQELRRRKANLKR